MVWRALLTVLYASAFGCLLALQNVNPGAFDVPTLVIWLVAPIVGFLVGRWWVMIAVVGVVIGPSIGWDPGENDGTSAFWWPRVVVGVISVGFSLFVGVALYKLRQWQRHTERPNSVASG